MINFSEICSEIKKIMETNTLLQKPKLNNTSTTVKVAVAKGDGIGPEIMDATLKILKAAGANIEPEFIELGEQVYLGIPLE